MGYNFPSYQNLFEVTKRRLNRLKIIASKKTGELNDQDKFMFLIIGNINLRFNTICLLLKTNNYDGVFALQRTIFELQLAFEAYMQSDDKDEFLKFYFKKSNFETVIKWHRLIEKSNEEQTDMFTQEDQQKIEEWKRTITEDLDISNRRERSKVWYELATAKSVKELSYEFLSAIEYFISYDEPSNWIHPQRLEENMNTDFDNILSSNYMNILIIMLREDIKWIVEDITKVAEHVGVTKSKSLYEHLKNLEIFDEKLIEIASDINKNIVENG